MVATMIAHAIGSGLLAAGQGEAPGWLLVLGPAGAGAFYVAVWQYYRNSKKSHSFELETRIESKPVTGNDAKVNEITGTKKSSIDNANHDDHRQRVQRFQ